MMLVKNVIAKLQQHEGEIATSTTVWQELVFGCERLPNSKKRRFLERYLNQIVRLTIPILPYDVDAATWHGLSDSRLDRQHKGVELLKHPTNFASCVIPVFVKI